jgi:hypothetical protein
MAKGPTDYRPADDEGETYLELNTVTNPRKGRQTPSAGLPFFDDPELMEWLNPSAEEPPAPRPAPKPAVPKQALSAADAVAALMGEAASAPRSAAVAERPRLEERAPLNRPRPHRPLVNRRETPKPRPSRESQPPAKPVKRARPARRPIFPNPLECLRTGWREWQRSHRRRELERERERIVAGLAHLEARLGVLEWRRLERKEELRRPMGRIQRVERIHERQQERLRFVEGAMRELNREEERLRKKEQVTLERLDDQINGHEERDRHAEKRLSEIDARISRLDDALMELDDEDGMVIATLSDLQLAGIETPEDEERRVELEERRRAIPRQAAQMESERDELEAEAERRQREKESLYERLLALEGERRHSARHFNRGQRRLDSRRESLRRRFQATEETARHLRRQVWEPYQEVGARLADAGAGSAAQPYLLNGIRALRAEIEEVEREIADLVKASLAESRLEKFLCGLIWLLLGLGLPALGVLAAWYWRGGEWVLSFVQ